MVSILAGANHLVRDHLRERACSFRGLVLRREMENPFLIVRERGLSLGAGAGAARAMRGSRGCCLSKRGLGPIDNVPRGWVRMKILVIHLERRVERIGRARHVINTRRLVLRRRRN